MVLLANEEPLPLPLLLCADGLYGPLEVGLDPLGLLPFGDGGVWGLACWPYDSLLPGTGGTPEALAALLRPPLRGPLSGPEVFLCSAGLLFPLIAGDELLEDGSEGNVGEILGEPSE